MTPSAFLKTANKHRKELAARTTKLLAELAELEKLAEDVMTEMYAARDTVLEELVDEDEEVDELDVDIVETMDELSWPGADDLRGAREALEDDWVARSAEVDRKLETLGQVITEAKQARRQ